MSGIGAGLAVAGIWAATAFICFHHERCHVQSAGVIIIALLSTVVSVFIAAAGG